MKHPDRAEWIPYIFGEAQAPERRQLEEHLAQCSDCAREMAGWRRSLKTLDSWPVPGAPIPDVRPHLYQSVKWALAAAVVLGFGVLLGKLSAPSEAKLAAMRVQMEASLRAGLREDLNEALDDVENRSSNAIRAMEARLTEATSADSQRLWRTLADVLDTTRSEDRRNVQAVVRRLEEQHNSQFVALRKDLETLASTTDDEIRQARLSLIHLASLTDPENR